MWSYNYNGAMAMDQGYMMHSRPFGSKNGYTMVVNGKRVAPRLIDPSKVAKGDEYDRRSSILSGHSGRMTYRQNARAKASQTEGKSDARMIKTGNNRTARISYESRTAGKNDRRPVIEAENDRRANDAGYNWRLAGYAFGNKQYKDAGGYALNALKITGRNVIDRAKEWISGAISTLKTGFTKVKGTVGKWMTKAKGFLSKIGIRDNPIASSSRTEGRDDGRRIKTGNNTQTRVSYTSRTEGKDDRRGIARSDEVRRRRKNEALSRASREPRSRTATTR